MLKTTSAAGGLAIAAATAGILLTGSPASAQALTGHGHHRWGSYHRYVASHRVFSRNHNRNINVTRVVVPVRVINRNNNVAVARNVNRPNRFFGGGGCCNRFGRDGFLGDGFVRRDGFLGRDGFIDGVDGFGDGVTAVVGRRGTFARAGDAAAFVD
ncbi:hypothetical protein [Actinoallomurus rhizosphaericola]|uniref:hypothetical protein n=1 Tax=Actinoallomurus rhizosphaericola TaxID=2952536 RepID=UPI0020937487|nr:hypothetical protein [Actinoallomurus rhizosphaericola]MCO5996214.1 hypothetical protein [Actinoallomurus rhizosphaericola]